MNEVHIETINNDGVGSNYSYYEFKNFLCDTRGTVELRIIWEDGSIEYIKIGSRMPGELKQNRLNIRHE